eukprot:COSAG02_NODE_3054_length_7458_cov_5.759750_7_plen_51_part_00
MELENHPAAFCIIQCESESKFTGMNRSVRTLGIPTILRVGILLQFFTHGN